MVEKASYPWTGQHRAIEFGLATSALALLAAQQLVEGYYYCRDEQGFVPSDLQSAWVILLIIYVSLAVGVAKRSQKVTWLATVLIAILAFLTIRTTISIICRFLYPPPYCWYRPWEAIRYLFRPNYFRAFWLVSQNFLLVSVPVLLLIGILRSWIVEKIRRKRTSIPTA